MPGIIIEAWRGAAGGVAQCHRCQAFGHASSNCHRPLRCVRCGDAHPAAECPRPIDAKPTCANCNKAHTANDRRCTVYRREARKRGKKTQTPLPPMGATRGRAQSLEPHPRERTVAPSRAQAVEQGATLHTAANPPTERGAPMTKRSRRTRGRRGRKSAPTASSTPLPTTSTKGVRVHFTETRTAPEVYLAPSVEAVRLAPVSYQLPTATTVPRPWPRTAPKVPTASQPAVPATPSEPSTRPAPWVHPPPWAPRCNTVPQPQHENHRPIVTATQFETYTTGGSAGDPMLTMLGILADLLSSIVAGEDLCEAAKRGLAQIKRNHNG